MNSAFSEDLIKKISITEPRRSTWNMNMLTILRIDEFRAYAHQYIILASSNAKYLPCLYASLRELFRLFAPMLELAPREALERQFNIIAKKTAVVVEEALDAEKNGLNYLPCVEAPGLLVDYSTLFDNIYSALHVIGLGIESVPFTPSGQNPFKKAVEVL